MAERLYDDGDYNWSYEIKGEIAIFRMEGWQGYADEELKSATEAYREVVSQEDIKANVTVVTDSESIPKESQEYIAENWAKNINFVEVERCAFVSDGLTAMTLKANVEDKAEKSEVESFNDFEKALEWVKNE